MFRRDGLNAGPLPASRFARADFALAKGDDGKRRRLPNPFRGSCRRADLVNRHSVPFRIFEEKPMREFRKKACSGSARDSPAEKEPGMTAEPSC